MKGIIIFSTMFLALMAVAVACPTVSSKTMQDFYNEIPSINTELQTCPIKLPNNLKFLVGSGNIAVNVAMNGGSTTSFTVVVFGGQITNINQGATQNRFSVNLDEDSANQVISSTDKTGTIISLFNQKKITTKSSNPFTSVKLAIARVGLKLFGGGGSTIQQAAPTTKVYPQPADCEETWLPGHRNYPQYKETWDSYSAQSDGVCQSMKPVSCKFNVQLSIEGRPYYLCWYDE